jgi:DNA-binding transcriptional ArsR family regulator
MAQHLRILQQAGLVRRERYGVRVIYELADVRARLFARGLTNLLR